MANGDKKGKRKKGGQELGTTQFPVFGPLSGRGSLKSPDLDELLQRFAVGLGGAPGFSNQSFSVLDPDTGRSGLFPLNFQSPREVPRVPTEGLEAALRQLSDARVQGAAGNTEAMERLLQAEGGSLSRHALLSGISEGLIGAISGNKTSGESSRVRQLLMQRLGTLGLNAAQARAAEAQVAAIAPAEAQVNIETILRDAEQQAQQAEFVEEGRVDTANLQTIQQGAQAFNQFLSSLSTFKLNLLGTRLSAFNAFAALGASGSSLLPLVLKMGMPEELAQSVAAAQDANLEAKRNQHRKSFRQQFGALDPKKVISKYARSKKAFELAARIQFAIPGEKLSVEELLKDPEFITVAGNVSEAQARSMAEHFHNNAEGIQQQMMADVLEGANLMKGLGMVPESALVDADLINVILLAEQRLAVKMGLAAPSSTGAFTNQSTSLGSTLTEIGIDPNDPKFAKAVQDYLKRTGKSLADIMGPEGGVDQEFLNQLGIGADGADKGNERSVFDVTTEGDATVGAVSGTRTGGTNFRDLGEDVDRARVDSISALLPASSDLDAIRRRTAAIGTPELVRLRREIQPVLDELEHLAPRPGKAFGGPDSDTLRLGDQTGVAENRLRVALEKLKTNNVAAEKFVTEITAEARSRKEPMIVGELREQAAQWVELYQIEANSLIDLDENLQPIVFTNQDGSRVHRGSAGNEELFEQTSEMILKLKAVLTSQAAAEDALRGFARVSLFNEVERRNINYTNIAQRLVANPDGSLALGASPSLPNLLRNSAQTPIIADR